MHLPVILADLQRIKIAYVIDGIKSYVRIVLIVNFVVYISIIKYAST